MLLINFVFGRFPQEENRFKLILRGEQIFKFQFFIEKNATIIKDMKKRENKEENRSGGLGAQINCINIEFA